MKKITLAFLMTLLMSCSGNTNSSASSDSAASSASPSTATTTTSSEKPASTPASVAASTTAADTKFDVNKEYNISMETTMGTIKLKLYPKVAPKAVENFVGLANKKYYDGIIFHRVIQDFMIQGGDPTGTGTAGESIFGKPFEDEFSPDVKFDKVGLLAMANSGPTTNGSQFFITLNVEHTQHLHMKHTIFGEVTEGMDVVNAIGKTGVDPRDKPIVDVVMKKVRVL